MITPAQLKPFRYRSIDDGETRDLLRRFKNLKGTRKPFYLTGEELDRIFRWKLRSQYGRNKKKRDSNAEAAYRAVTQAALGFQSQDDDYELEVRAGLLTTLRGVGVPVASAILALTDPERYCVVDTRGWWQVFDEKKTSFNIKDYVKYRNSVALLARELGWGIAETDFAIWEYDRTSRKKP